MSRGRVFFGRRKKTRQLIGGVDGFSNAPIDLSFFLPLYSFTKTPINSPANLSSTSTVLDARGKREKRGSDEMWAKRGSAETLSCKAAEAAAALPPSETCGRRWPPPALPLLVLRSVVIADAGLAALWRGADASKSRESAARRERDLKRERERDFMGRRKPSSFFFLFFFRFDRKKKKQNRRRFRIFLSQPSR